MTTKENYQDAIMRMYDFCISSNHPTQIREQFTQDLDFLAKLAEEHFEEKEESNLEHYKKEIKSAGYEFALVNGKPTTCKWILCDQCFFNNKSLCSKKRIEWMLKPFKRKYQLTQFEYDLLQSYANGYKFKDINPLVVMKEKGYFKDVYKGAQIDDVLENCEVIKND